VSDHEKIGPGIDLVLDANDHPRFVCTLYDHIIGLVYGLRPSCTPADANGSTKVEMSSSIPADPIFLWPNCTWPNCTVGAWFPRSRAGTDTSLSRLAILPGAQEP